MRRPAAAADPVVDVLDLVARFGLAGAPAEPTDSLDPGVWRGLLNRVGRERIEGLLAAAVAAGAVKVTEEQYLEAVATAKGRAWVDLSLERELLVTTGALGTAGIDCRVLKGPAWSHSIYPDPAWRGFGDVDLLVTAEDWDRSVTVLEARGTRPVPEIRPGFDRRFGKDATFLSDSGWEIDLHRTLAAGPFGLWVDARELFRRSAEVTIGGVALPTLDPETAFVHACYNAVLADDPPRVIAVRDVCQMIVTGRADPAGVEEITRRWRAKAVVARAISLAGAMLGDGIWDQPVAAPFASYRLSGLDRAILAAYRGPGRGYTSQAAAMVAMGGARERLEYLRALTRPQPSYLAARGLTPLAHFSRGARRLREGR